MWGNMMAHMGGYGWGHMLLGGLMMVLFWGAVIALLVFLVRGLTRSRGEVSSGVIQQRPTPLEILQERYARREMDRREYEERRKDLSQ